MFLTLEGTTDADGRLVARRRSCLPPPSSLFHGPHAVGADGAARLRPLGSRHRVRAAAAGSATPAAVTVLSRIADQTTAWSSTRRAYSCRPVFGIAERRYHHRATAASRLRVRLGFGRRRSARASPQRAVPGAVISPPLAAPQHRVQRRHGQRRRPRAMILEVCLAFEQIGTPPEWPFATRRCRRCGTATASRTVALCLRTVFYVRRWLTPYSPTAEIGKACVISAA